MTLNKSQNPCADTYAGSQPDSELETRAVQGALRKQQGKWDAYVSLHTYGNLWLTPWAYTEKLPSDNDDLIEVSQIGADALKSVYNTVYTVGSPAITLCNFCFILLLAFEKKIS